MLVCEGRRADLLAAFDKTCLMRIKIIEYEKKQQTSILKGKPLLD